jgi:hypothetical protein
MHPAPERVTAVIVKCMSGFTCTQLASDLLPCVLVFGDILCPEACAVTGETYHNGWC